MIGDNYQTDILGAMSAGIDTMLVNRWNIGPNDITTDPNFIVGKLTEIQPIL